MSFRRRFVVAAILVGIGALPWPAAPGSAQSNGAPELRFLFALGAVTGPADKPHLQAVQNDAVLRSGDRLKFFVEPRTPASAYVLHQAADGELTVIAPAEGRPATLEPGRAVYVPAADNWLQLDHQTGTERFHVVVASQRIESLDALLSGHAAITEKAALQASSEAILNEIKQLRLKHRNLSTPAEKPVRIGGSLRAPDTIGSGALLDIAPLASEITATGGVYIRTITIDHR